MVRLTSQISILGLLFLIGCGGGTKTSPDYGSDPLEVGPEFESYCSTVTAYSAGITVSGSATYQARSIDYSLSSPTEGLGAATAAIPIRHAEVAVKDANKNVVQCGTTNASGQYSLALPNSGEKYTVYINSRGDNSYIKAIVANRPNQNQVYSISQTFTANASKTLPTLNAEATDEIIGAAFNIFDQVLNANDYLRAQVGTCNFANCDNFTVAPQVKVYWQAGLHPGQVFGAGAGSFYIKDSGRLFILGGSNGNVSSVDTDHFDNSVILHEYAHFLEDNMSAANSPGGAHYLDGPIDPRLAWSEGFANFFQAAVLGISSYVDTEGNSDGNTSDYIRLNLESNNLANNYVWDVASNNNEGNFRELSVTRLLFDAIDTNNDSETVSGTFDELWASITSSTGFKKAAHAFRSIGLVHQTQNSLAGKTSWASIQSNERHINNRSEYALYVEPSASCDGSNNANGLYTMDYKMESSIDNATYSSVMNSFCGTYTINGTGMFECFAGSHLVINNDFLHYKHSGGTLSLSLSYTGATPLFLFVYKTDAIYGSGNYIVNNILSAEGIGPNSPQTFSQNLAAGDYLINVKVKEPLTGNGTSNYELSIGGTRACQASL